MSLGDDYKTVAGRTRAETNGQPDDDPERIDSLLHGQGDDLDASWQPIDLVAVAAGTIRQPLPTVLRRSDEEYLLYAAAVNGVHGDSGAGKGWLVCLAILQVVRAGRGVVFIDLEDVPASIVARLTGMGATSEQLARIVYLRPQTQIGGVVLAHLLELIATHDVGLVVVDSLGEAFSLAGIDENKDAEVGPWLRSIARPLADAGPAVLLIDHSTKAGDNPLYPSGSKRKRAAITGASYLVEATKPFVKHEGGRLRLTCAKDRHGNYRHGSVVAALVMAERLDESIVLDLYEPTPSSDPSPALKLAQLAELAVEIVRDHQHPPSQNELMELMGTGPGRATASKRAAIDAAVNEGSIERHDGPRKSLLYTYLKDYG